MQQSFAREILYLGFPPRSGSASGSHVGTPPPFSKTAPIDAHFLITHSDGTEETLVHMIGAK